MRIQNNIMAMNSHRNLTINNSGLSKNLEKLSSGYRINRAGDDAAGLAISEKMRAQINGLEQAQNNANDAISLIQTAEGGLNETHAMLQRLQTLTKQSQNGTFVDGDREKIQLEVNALMEEIDRVTESTKFNGQTLLNGTFDKTGKAMTFAIGAYDETIQVNISAMDSEGLFGTGTTTINISTQAAALDVDDKITDAIDLVSEERAKLGAVQNRLEHTVANLAVTEENVQASESRIRDVDMAKEMMAFTKNNILSQAAQSMLAQANMQPQGVLQLLQ